jgi:hypothetical protein
VCRPVAANGPGRRRGKPEQLNIIRLRKAYEEFEFLSLRHVASTAEKFCYLVREIRERPAVSFCWIPSRDQGLCSTAGYDFAKAGAVFCPPRATISSWRSLADEIDEKSEWRLYLCQIDLIRKIRIRRPTDSNFRLVFLTDPDACNITILAVIFMLLQASAAVPQSLAARFLGFGSGRRDSSRAGKNCTVTSGPT